MQRAGSLEPGRLSELAILDRHPLTCPIGAVNDVCVLETYICGRPVYAAK
jgi:predicted amidohydrolase YtcJ